MRRALTVWILLAGCDARSRTPLVTPAVWLAGGDAVEVEAVGASGAAPLEAWVRAVNGYGASVPSDSRTVLVNGNPQFVTFDGLGYGSLSFPSPGLASLDDSVRPAVAVAAYAAEFAPPGLTPAVVAPIPDATMADLVTDGAVGVRGGELWWTDMLGQRPHRVFSAPDNILGMKVVQADVDTILDVLVWTQNTVFLLRGRVGGGLAWGGALSATGYRVAGADMGDLSFDNVPDLAVAWEGGPDQTGLLDVWNGDGLLGFTPSEPKGLELPPLSLAVADNAGNGQPQATIMHGDGTWSRYVEGAPGRYMPIGPRTPQSVLPVPGSSLYPAFDINGDGADEIVVMSPLEGEANRDIFLFDLITQGLSALPLRDEPGARIAGGDGDGDLVKDLWLHRSDGIVQVVHYDPLPLAGGSSYPRTTALTESPGPGPIGVIDVDLDGENDLWLAAPKIWWTYRGRGVPFDAQRFWELQEPEDTFIREEVIPPFRVGDLDGQPLGVEAITFHRDGGQLELLVLGFAHDDVRAERLGSINLSGNDPVDLAVCGKTAYALTDNTLYTIDLNDLTRPTSVGSLALSGAQAVTCGTGPNNAVAAVLGSADVVLLSRTLAEIGRSAAIGSFELAFVDLGAGPEVRTCSVADCTIIGWSLSDGSRGVVIGDPTSVTWFDSVGVGRELGGTAQELQLFDVDLDGVIDLVSSDEATGLVGVYREVGGVVTPPRLWRSPFPWEGGVGLHDADLDGAIDLWGIDAAGDLRYVHPERDEPTPTTTGNTPDTGDVAHTGDTGLP